MLGERPRSDVWKILHETIDNLPISLVTRGCPRNAGAKIAIGLDTRTRDFTKAVLDMLAELSAHSWLSLEVVFVTASNAILVRRFSETRRRYPLASMKRYRTELTANAIC